MGRAFRVLCKAGLDHLGYNKDMRRLLLHLLAGSVGLVFCSGGLAQPVTNEPVYRFDPALIVESPRPTVLSADPQGVVVVEKNEAETSVHLRTESTVSPYIDAEIGPELSPEELRLLPESATAKGAADYKLEAGLGLYVADQARLNLGYRLQNQPLSLLNDRRDDPFTLSGDLRVTFDVKVPFD